MHFSRGDISGRLTMSTLPSMRVLIDAPDIAFLMALPGVDQQKVREYFSQQGLLKIYDELEKERR